MNGYFQKALEVDPNEPSAHLGLAELHLQTHRLDEATAEFARYLELQPGERLSVPRPGEGRGGAGRRDGGRRLLREVGQRWHPATSGRSSSGASSSSGWGGFESALGFIDRALKLDAGEPEVHYQRSLILARLGRAAESRAEQDAAARPRG